MRVPRTFVRVAAAVVLTACGGHAAAQTPQPAMAGHSMANHATDATAAAADGASADSASLERDLARLREATAAFRDLAAAAAAGYAREAPQCVAHPEHGAMGFHHENASLVDGRVELEHPEILVYGRAPDGTYKLNGVEYVVPYTAHPRDAAPPTIMGQPLLRADKLGIWFRHVWVWEPNPSGMFASWNPAVKC